MNQILREADQRGTLGDTQPFEREVYGEQPGGTLQRVLNLQQLVFFGIGSLIGSGVFVLTGQVASSSTGPALVRDSIFVISLTLNCIVSYYFNGDGCRLFQS